MLVGRVSVRGNVSSDTTRILRTFDVHSGDRYTRDAIGRGVRKLMALGVFDDVVIDDRGRHDNVIDLVIVVRERPRIAHIAFTGNAKKSTKDLEKKLFIHAGEVYSPSTARTQVDTLLKVYREAGYARATIDARPDTLADNQVNLTFAVQEGEKVRITRIRFEGVHAFPAKRLAKQLKSKKKGFFGGGEPDEEKFPEDREGVEAWYHDHGYRDARVTREVLEPGAEPRALTLVLTVDEGSRYRQGNVTWAGNQVVSDAVLKGLWRPRPGDLYDQSRVQKADQDAYGEYAEHGYLYLQIEPNETVRNDSLVDVTYTVTEGRPSNVRYVLISGNRGTREKVIRREIDLREGDRFRRSALKRTQEDIFRLGLFEDVQVDFAAAESTDVDIRLKVKEKQVGTASAGAGYTNQNGLTGFLELGHNNVLGNGQSLSLHLERGSSLENYYLSFTEPWFRDTPTLLGFSAFNSERQLDLYDEKQIGASGRIGRPLPWPDYSRGAISYQLEDVTLSRINTIPTTVDSVILEGQISGHPVRTSSMEFDFTRNSANSPFYPTGGTRLALTSELAGGPFGGSVNYHRHRLEGRVYLPSGIKGITTMLRGRLGFVGEYLDQQGSVPPYERFRLGGGSTPDPLRGYDDYQVVPPKFDYFILDLQQTTTTDAAGVVHTVLDTLGLRRVRYPGGRLMSVYTVEEQFPIVHPLHGVLFFDAGNTWDRVRELQPFNLKMGAGIGFRLEIPLLGNIGFDYGYGFNRDDGAKWVGHFLLGNVNQ